MSSRELDRLFSDVGELLDRKGANPDRDFSRYVDDPVGFMRDVLKFEPWSKQELIAVRMLDERLVLVPGAVSVGKDALSAAVALWWVYVRGGFVVVSAPTQRQVREIFFGEVSRMWHRANLPGELYATALRLGPNSEAGIIGFTSSSVSALTGFHAPRVLVILSEAQGIEGYAWEAAFSCATGPEDRILAVGNPLEPSGQFYNAAQSGRWSVVKIPVSDHPNIVEGRTVIPGGPSPALVENLEAEYGADSGIVQARLHGEFPHQGEEGLFARVWLDDAAQRFGEGFLHRQAQGMPPMLSVDPARYGPDSTVVAIRRGRVIEELVSWKHAGTMETVARIEAIASRVGCHPYRDTYNRSWGVLVVDAVGLGAGIADRLAQKRYAVEQFNGGHYSMKKDKFLNRRAESYWRLRELLEAGEIALPDHPELFDELLAVRWSPTPDGKVRLEAKTDLKARLGRSPDFADAVSMAFAPRRTMHVTTVRQ